MRTSCIDTEFGARSRWRTLLPAAWGRYTIGLNSMEPEALPHRDKAELKLISAIHK